MEMKAIALDDLKPGKSLNARKKKTGLDSLERSILTNGLLVPLIVQQSMDVGYSVIAGNRRLECLLRIKRKKASAIDPVTCMVIAGNEAPGIAQLLEISRVENVEREPLHPVDEFEVFAEQVNHGATVDDIAGRTGMKAAQVRQTLSLARMAQEIRDAWRIGELTAEAAEAFTVTSDHEAQRIAFNKVKKSPTPWNVRQALSGKSSGATVATMLKFVGREAYEAAGHTINATLFTHAHDAEDEITVSDVPALVAMSETKLRQKCESLVKAGWGWAMIESEAPKDIAAWKRMGGEFTKEQRSSMGCVVRLNWQGKPEVQQGIVKPGDKVTLPKSAAEKKKSAKERETKREESGGISNALAERMSRQMTAIFQNSVVTIKGADAIALAASVLACRSEATPRLSLGTEPDVLREQNDLPKYFKALSKKTMPELTLMLMWWIGQSIDLYGNSGACLAGLLRPEGGSVDTKFIASLLPPSTFTAEAVKRFDADDYFASVSRSMIVEALVEMDKKTIVKELSAVKKDELVKTAVAQAKKTKWLPLAMRLP